MPATLDDRTGSMVAKGSPRFPLFSRGLVILALLAASMLALPQSGLAATARKGQFVVRCKYSHTAADDPIVLPGQPGAAHSHDFFGNESVNAFSTMESMLAGSTTCRVPSDTAGYWSPTAYLNGVQIIPTVMRIYYLGQANADIETIPPGMQMIGGNVNATSIGQNPHVNWYCGATKEVRTPLRSTPYDCTPYAQQYGFVDGVVAVIDMPNCWDGAGLTPDHLVYRGGSECPPDHPHVLPRLSQRVHLAIMNPLNSDGTVALTLSSGSYYTMHADFWNTWQQDRLDQLIETCLVAGVNCGTVEDAPRMAWAREFGTVHHDQADAVAATSTDVYVGGYTNDQPDGDLGRHRPDAYVRRYDIAGTERWSRPFGTRAGDRVTGIAVADTRIYAVGVVEGRLPGQLQAGEADGFLRAYRRDGTELWTRQFGTHMDDEALGVATDGVAVYVCGFTDGRLGPTRAGGRDAFVRRYDKQGGVVWTRQFGTRASDTVVGISAISGQMYVAGSTNGALSGPAKGEQDAFLRRYDPRGRAVWTRQFGTPDADEADAVIVRSGTIYVGGSSEGELAAGGEGGRDAFVRSYDAAGTHVWTQQFGTSGTDDARAIVAASRGLIVAGTVTDALPGQSHLGGSDGYVRKYLAKGIEAWTIQFGTTDDDQGLATAIGDETGAYVVGTTSGALEGQSSAGDADAYIVRLRYA